MFSDLIDGLVSLGEGRRPGRRVRQGAIGQHLLPRGRGTAAGGGELLPGYRFVPGCETVYNPVSVGLFFTRGHGQSFDDY